MSLADFSQMMSPSDSPPSPHEHRVPRKSAPSRSSLRHYPEPDPGDPFAPLEVLRSRGMNGSLISIHEGYPHNTHAAPLLPLPNVTASLRPISISKQRSFAGARPCSQDITRMLEDNGFPGANKSHYRRRTHSIAVTSESLPYTFHNLQTYILPIAQSPEMEESPSELPTPSMTAGSSAISCASDDDSSPEDIPRSLYRNRKSTASFAKYRGRLRPRRSQSKLTDSDALPSSTSALSNSPDSDSSSQHDIRSHNKSTATPQESTSDHDSTRYAQPESELFTFPRASQSSLVPTRSTPRAFPRSRTLSVDVPLPMGPNSPGQYLKPRHSCMFVPDLQAPEPVAQFDEIRIPTIRQLSEAASCIVIAENGLRVPFGDLWMAQKTVVCFIRHFWCPSCQDYMYSISTDVDPVLLEQAGINLVIISNGSYKLIKFYRQIFRCPFALYTDPTLQVYTAMGMTLKRAVRGQEPQCGGYVRRGPVSGVAMVVKNAVRVGMPVWEKGGDISQLGGEFILGPGLQCTFAHRMRTRRGHLPITGVLRATGLELATPAEQVNPLKSQLCDRDIGPDGEMSKTSAQRKVLKRRTRRMAKRDMWCITSCETQSMIEGNDKEGYVVYQVQGGRNKPHEWPETARDG